MGTSPHHADSEPMADTLAQANTIAAPGSVRAENVYSVAPGTLLSGKYRVVRTIGRGGMGLVVEAFHLELQIPVAIKILLPEFMAYAEAATRFQREPRAVIKLTSPHVARVLDVDALPSGEPFIVMEHLKGEDLAERGRKSIPLSVGETLDYVVQACDAIAEAHSLGIVHRDIKPANLFVVPRTDGEVTIKVLDFGVSKVLSGSTGEVSLTQTTTILGSALYMSPEQMRSAKNVDARTDIYALGACLYEMLARRPPYVAGSFPELCALVYSGPPHSVTEWSPDVPDGLAKVIDKSLAHLPEDRHADVAELVQALAPYAQESTRARIEAILGRYAPHRELPPPARRRRSVEPVYRDENADVPPARGGRWLPWALLALLGALGFGVLFRAKLPWALVSGATEARTPAAMGVPPASAAAPATAAPETTVAAAPTPNPAAETAPAATVAIDAPGASAAPTSSANAAAPASSAAAVAPPISSASAVPRNAPRPGQGNPLPVRPSVADRRNSPPVATVATAGPGSEPAAPGTVAAPSPMINPGLSEQTCYAIQPDGSRQTVPCN